MSRIFAVIFDLDNVLFDEQEYILAAYQEIARFLSGRFNLDEKEIYERLNKNLRKKTSMYPRLFNDLLRDLEIDQDVLKDLLTIYSSVSPHLRFSRSTSKILKDLRIQSIKLGLLTNGRIETQRNKIQLLGLEKYFDAIVYAREIGKGKEKPSPHAYGAILKALDVKAGDAVCVGDNPYTDFLGAKELGIKTVRLLRGEYKNTRLAAEYEADIMVRTLGEFHSLVKKLNKSK